MAREGVVGRGGPNRPGRRRGLDRTRHRGVDGPAGRLEDGARARGRVRREDAPEALRLARVLPRLPARAGRSAAAALDAGTSTCSRCSASRSRSRSSTAERSSAASRSSTRCSRICWPVGSGSASAGARECSGRSGRRGCSPPPRSSSSGSGSGSTSRRLAVSSTSASRVSSAPTGFSTARRRTGTCPSAARSSRAARRTRRGRYASASRRTGAARRRSSAATRTAPSPTSPTFPRSRVFGWSGKWDSLPAAHTTSIAFDLLAVLALLLIGLRFGGRRLAVLLAFAWAAYPFTAYTLDANTNDAIMPAFLLLGFWLVTSDWARGASVALAGWTKFGALLVAPLWATYPTYELRRVLRFAAAFVVATVLAFALLLLEPSLWEALRTFWDRTIGFQSERDSPFSIWGWGQYHARGDPGPRLPATGRRDARRRTRSATGVRSREGRVRSSSPLSPRPSSSPSS